MIENPYDSPQTTERLPEALSVRRPIALWEKLLWSSGIIVGATFGLLMYYLAFTPPPPSDMYPLIAAENWRKQIPWHIALGTMSLAFAFVCGLALWLRERRSVADVSENLPSSDSLK